MAELGAAYLMAEFRIFPEEAQNLAAQAREGWSAKVIDRLAADLRHEFPEMKGLSPRTLEYMRALADAFPDRPFVQTTLAQIPRYHAITLLDKVRDFRRGRAT